MFRQAVKGGTGGGVVPPTSPRFRPGAAATLLRKSVAASALWLCFMWELYVTSSPAVDPPTANFSMFAGIVPLDRGRDRLFGQFHFHWPIGLSRRAVCPARWTPRGVSTKKHGIVPEVPDGRCVGVRHPSAPDRRAEEVVCPGRPFSRQRLDTS